MSQQSSQHKNISTRGTVATNLNNTGQTALHIAAAAGDLEQVERLLDAKTSVVATDNIQQTPLHKAAQNNHAKVVEKLLVRGGYQGRGSSRYLHTTKDSKGQTPYDLALANGHYEVIRSMLSQRAIKTSAELDRGLAKAVALGHAEIAKLLLDSKAEAGSEHPHLLYHALEPGKEKVLAVLLESKSYGAISINVPRKEGPTPLEYAVQRGNAEGVQALLAAKAKVFQKHLLHLAAKSGNSDVLTILLKVREHGDAYLDVNELDSKGLTPLEYAAQSGNTASVKVLLNAKARVFQRNLLQFATKGGNGEVLTILLEAKADPKQIPQRNVSTPLHFSVNFKPDDHKFHDAVVLKLITANAPLDVLDEKGYAPLHRAAIIGNPLAVQILLEAKANPQQKSKMNLFKLDFGKTAFDLAKNQDEILDLLRPKQPTRTIRPSRAAVAMGQLKLQSSSLTQPDSKTPLLTKSRKPNSPVAVAAMRGFIGAKNKLPPTSVPTYSSMTELIPLRDRTKPQQTVTVWNEEELDEIFAGGSEEPYFRPDT